MKYVKNRSKFHEKAKWQVMGSKEVLLLIFSARDDLVKDHANRMLGSARKLPSLLWPAEWKAPAPLQITPSALSMVEVLIWWDSWVDSQSCNFPKLLKRFVICVICPNIWWYLWESLPLCIRNCFRTLDIPTRRHLQQECSCYVTSNPARGHACHPTFIRLSFM